MGGPIPSAAVNSDLCHDALHAEACKCTVQTYFCAQADFCVHVRAGTLCVHTCIVYVSECKLHWLACVLCLHGCLRAAVLCMDVYMDICMDAYVQTYSTYTTRAAAFCAHRSLHLGVLYAITCRRVMCTWVFPCAGCVCTDRRIAFASCCRRMGYGFPCMRIACTCVIADTLCVHIYLLRVRGRTTYCARRFVQAKCM